MATSIYTINKGINKSIEFKGLKAQYILYLMGLIVVLLIVFALLYFIGIDQYVCVCIVGISGFFGVTKIFSLSKKYGEHGLMKAMAQRLVPKVLRCNERSIFYSKISKAHLLSLEQY